MNRFRTQKLILLFMVSLLIVPLIAYGDVGPKPSLEINVIGIDTDEYWLDLLIKDVSGNSWLEISDEERLEVAKLEAYEDKDGFKPALLLGTGAPMWGGLRGEKLEDGSFRHYFGYIGVPDEFKIAILKKDGTLIVSDVVQRTQFQSYMDYDLSNIEVSTSDQVGVGIVREQIPWGFSVFGFVVRLLLTLVLEIGIALLFGFTFKNSLKVLLITNLVTQVILNVLTFGAYTAGGFFFVAIVFSMAEVLIIIAELVVYMKLLTEKKKWIRAVYAIVANIVTFLAGFMLFSFA